MLSPGLQQVLFGSTFYPGATLALDFLAGKYRAPGVNSSTPDFASLPNLTVTRATPSVAYGTTSGGVLVPFAANVARITDQGLLVEEARTNLALNSATIGDIANGYSLTGVTASLNQSAAPWGASVATLLTVDSANSAHRTVVASNITVTATAATISVYAKAGTTTTVGLEMAVTDASQGRAWYTLSGAGTATVLLGTSASATITRLGSTAWYRIALTATLGVTTIKPTVAITDGTGSFNFIGNGTDAASFVGLQLEQAAFALSYVPTVASTVTRAADSVSIGSLSPGVAFTLLAKATTPAINSSGNAYLASVSDGTTANFAGLNLSSTTAGTAMVVATVAQVASGLTTTTTGTPISIAAQFQTNTIHSAANGTLGSVPSNTFAMPTLTQINLGNRTDGIRTLNGYIQKAVIYPRAFSDAELVAATQ